MANPRKFSEKIALHNQKQAEETAAFEQIMREVIGATRQESSPQSFATTKSPHHLHISQNMGSYRAGSLPNVNQIDGHNNSGNNKSGIDLQAALHNLEEMKQGREEKIRDRHFDHFQNQRRMESCSPYSINYLSPPPDTNWRRTHSDSSLHQSAMMMNNQTLHDNFNGMISCSSNTRRAMNDVAMDDSSINDSWDPGKDNDKLFLTASLPSDDSRPKSCEVPGITIYPTQEENNSGQHHMPISSNTGSLPDLTSLHFPAPLATPIDIDDQNQSANQPASPYASPSSPYSPQSPNNHNINLSPPHAGMGMQNHHQHQLYQNQHRSGIIMTSGNTSGMNNGVLVENTGNQRQSSPGPSPSPTSSRRRAHHNLNNLVIGNPRHHANMHSNPLSPQHSQVCYNHHAQRVSHSPSPPRITVEGLAINIENALSIDGNAQYMPQRAQNMAYSQHASQQYNLQQQSQNYVPLSPSPLPSPQSPSQLSMGLHRSTTPSDHSCSAPTSPVSHHSHQISPTCSPGLPSNNHLSKSPFTDNSYFNVQQTSVLQHQLEQFKMVNDLQSDVSSSEQYLMMPGNGVINSSSSSASSSTGALFTTRGNLVDASGGEYSPQHSPLHASTLANSSVLCDSHYMTNTCTSPVNHASRASLIQSPTLAYSKSMISNTGVSYQQQSGSNQQVQTPQTPTSIPDIILTGPHHHGEDPLLRGQHHQHHHQDFAKDIGSAMASMTGSFDTSELFSSAEDALRAGLDPIDFDGLQILPDIDNSNDETFRLERS